MSGSQLEITPKEQFPAAANAQARPNLYSQVWDWGSGRAGSSRLARRPEDGCGASGADSAAGPGARMGVTSGAALTHEEAEEVEADEQHPLAAALPRVVVERGAAAVLTLRDDRLVVLVVLHGAGSGEPFGTLRAAAAQERNCGLGTRRPSSSNCRRG